MTAQPVEVARKGATGESQRARIEVIEGLFLDRVAGKGGDRAIDQRVDRATPVLPRAAPTCLSVSQQAASLAGQAAHSAVDCFL